MVSIRIVSSKLNIQLLLSDRYLFIACACLVCAFTSYVVNADDQYHCRATQRKLAHADDANQCASLGFFRPSPYR